MTHWGWYWKVKKQHTPKRICSGVPSIHATDICKRLGRERAKSGDVPDSCTVNYNDVNQKVTIEKWAQPLGGFTYFFHCPLCNKRMRILYCLETIGCRKCLKLCYLAQRLRTSDRNLMGSAKIEDALKKRGGSTITKPPRMHQTTWRRLSRRLRTYDSNYEAAVYHEAEQYYPAAAHML